MATVCASCGAENGPQDAYCYSCGVELGRTTTPDLHPDEAVGEASRTEREQAAEAEEAETEAEEAEDTVAYSSETGDA